MLGNKGRFHNFPLGSDLFSNLGHVHYCFAESAKLQCNHLLERYVRFRFVYEISDSKPVFKHRHNERLPVLIPDFPHDRKPKYI